MIIQFPQRKGKPTPKDAWLSVKDDYTLHLITQGRSRETIRTYLYNAAFFARWCVERQYPIISASRKHLELYVAGQLERHARSTAMNRLLACRSFYRFLIADRRRTTDPTEHIPVKRDKLQPRRPFSTAELRALMCRARQSEHHELLPMLLMLIGSGCRRAEVIGMHTDDVDWERGRILIRHAKGSKERWVAPGRTAMNALRGYLLGRTGQVWSIRGDTLYKWVRELGIEASVVRAHPHRFRVTFAHSFLKRKGNLPALSEILGHSSLRVTETYATWGIAEDALEMQADLDLASSYTEPVRIVS